MNLSDISRKERYTARERAFLVCRHAMIERIDSATGRDFLLKCAETDVIDVTATSLLKGMMVKMRRTPTGGISISNHD